MKRCTTHFICDCLQERIAELERTLRVIRTWASVPDYELEQAIINKCDEMLRDKETVS